METSELSFRESIDTLNFKLKDLDRLTNQEKYFWEEMKRKKVEFDVRLIVVQSLKSRHQYLRFFKKELSISRF